MKRKPAIPLYHLHDRAGRNFDIHTTGGFPDITHWNQPHRDDNYLLLFVQSGTGILMVDFREVTISGCAVYCIHPGQVHYGASVPDIDAFVIAVAPSGIRKHHRLALADSAIHNQPVPVKPEAAALFRDSLLLLDKMSRETSSVTQEQTLDAMLDVCVSLFTGFYRADLPDTSAALRPQLLTGQFKRLLLSSFRFMKRPSEYAAALHISPSYLNEVVKDTTGFPATHWIHQEIILEAKRMLFYTDSTVKEIAHELGYNDVTYFIRLFSRHTGMPPLQFRRDSRE